MSNIYDGMEVEGGTWKRCRHMGDGNWYEVRGRLMAHMTEVDGNIYIDQMQVQRLTLWQRIRGVFEQ